MERIPYASIVGSLMYAQICMRSDISFAVEMLSRYQDNPGMSHWKAANRVLRYLQGTKDYLLTYRRTENLEVIEYSDSNYVGSLIVENRLQVMCFYWVVELFQGEVLNRRLLLNLWHALRPQYMVYD